MYPDCEEHVKALEVIKTLYSSYAYILHDKDIYEDSDEVKKNHWHVVVQFSNKRFRSTVAKEIGIEINYLVGCSLDASLVYLIHFDNPEKYQYSPSEVYGTLLNRFNKLINSRGKDENDRVIDLIEYITTSTTAISTTEFATYCAKYGYWDVYRRSAVIFNNMLKEHNYSIGIRLTKQGFEKMSDDVIDKLIWKGIENG